MLPEMIVVLKKNYRRFFLPRQSLVGCRNILI